MTPTRRLSHLGGASVALLIVIMTGCVLPDRDIQIVDEAIQNKHAVRIVEATPLSPQAQAACDADLKGESLICQPGQPEDVLRHFLDPTLPDYNFCSCDRAAGYEANNKLPAFPVYVEDRLDDESPTPLYAAALLDVTPGTTDPQNAVRYRDYISPLQPLDLEDQLQYTPSKRPDPKLRVLNVGNGDPIDLCNYADNVPLKPGFHELRIIVTDRPWFKVQPDDPAGQAGVPDLASGATFDTTSYIFHCDDKSVDHCLTDCFKPDVEAL